MKQEGTVSLVRPPFMCRSPLTFGYPDTSKYTDFTVKTYPMNTAQPDDVTIAISHCGVCGSDVHTITGRCGSMDVEWCVPGHEIVGEVIAVGDNVKDRG